MGCSLGDGLIVASLAGTVVAWLYFRHAERRRRMEIVHQERLVAIEKGIPLPELPLDRPFLFRTPNPWGPLIHGIVWIALSLGAMVMLPLLGGANYTTGWNWWAVPLPTLFLGIGLILFYVLVTRRGHREPR